MSTIKLQGMKFHSLHGALPVESIIGNDFVVNISMDADTTKAETTDDLNGTINYAEVYDLVKAEMAIPSKLIEHVAYRIRKSLIEHFPEIEKLEVEVQKQRPPVNGEVTYASITLNYERNI
ncbi:MAG: dihydroneopterin aldolase [Paludibacteraceae bacterium]|nr:dihydroneopterin aldolase [Paludibacteraceae bacterium]